MKNPKRLILILGISVFLILLSGGMYQNHKVTLAHQTLANYAAFRGCQQMLATSEDAATCSLASGTVIKMVRFNDLWYLDGDLPCTGSPVSLQYFGCLI